MKISTKGRYGLRIMLDIAAAGGVVAIRDISERQGISVKYTEQIAGMLVRCGLVRSVRGPQGGYALIKPAEQYSVLEILEKCEGDITPVECVISAECPRAEGCATKKLWSGLYSRITGYLGGISLQNLVEGNF